MKLIQINFLKYDYYQKDGRRAGRGIFLKTHKQVMAAAKKKKLIIVAREGVRKPKPRFMVRGD